VGSVTRGRRPGKGDMNGVETLRSLIIRLANQDEEGSGFDKKKKREKTPSQ
jgi:hypothetical protein